jgi:hypothetical protein
VVDYQTARRQLMNKPFMETPKYREQQGRANRTGVYVCPDTGRALIQEFEKAFVSALRRQGMPFFAHSCVRTSEEQQLLFETGRSKARAGQSPHNYGMAVDVVHSVHAWDLERRAWDIVGHIGYETARRIGVDINWGGEWKFYDPAHWELHDWKYLAGKE